MNGYKIEMAKMRSLIERMNSNLTPRQAMLNESMWLNEAVRPKRREYNDLIELLYSKDFQNAKIVGLGYVVNAGVYKTIIPTIDRDVEFNDILSNQGHSGEWVDKLTNIRISDKYQKALSNGKSIRTSGLNVIAVVTYTLQWQNGEKFGKWYNDRLKGEEDLAVKYGVNPLDALADKEVNREKVAFNTVYNQKFRNGEQPLFSATKGGEPALYKDGSVKMAIKHASSFIKRQGVRYFYSTDGGELVEMPKNVMPFLTKVIGAKAASEVEEKVEELEDTYENALKTYRQETSQSIKQFPIRQVGFLTATVMNPLTNEKEHVAFVNKNVDGSEGTTKTAFMDVNPEALYVELKKMVNIEEKQQEAENIE